MKTQQFRWSMHFVRLVMIVSFLFTTSPLWGGVFRDDFEDGKLTRWRQESPFEPAPTLWQVVDGELECTHISPLSTVLMIGQETWTDYTVVCEVKLLEDFGPGDVDLIARRIHGKEPGLLFGVGDFDGRDAAFVNDMPTVKPDKQKPFQKLALNVWHRLELKAEEDEFTFWVNGQQALRYRNSTVTEGAVGLGVANYTARFDNVEISGPNVPSHTPLTWKALSVAPNGKLATSWAEIRRAR